MEDGLRISISRGLPHTEPGDLVLIFQSFNLIGDLTVYENVELPLTYRQKNAGRTAKLRVMEAWSASAWRIACGIIRRTTGGQQQRVRGGASPGRKPSILLADEPPETSIPATASGDGVPAEPASRRSDHLHGDARSRFAKHAQREVHLFDGRWWPRKNSRSSCRRRAHEWAAARCALCLAPVSHEPWITAVSVLTLALGTRRHAQRMFTLVDAPILFRSLPYPRKMTSLFPWGRRAHHRRRSFSLPANYLRWRTSKPRSLAFTVLHRRQRLAIYG